MISRTTKATYGNSLRDLSIRVAEVAGRIFIGLIALLILIMPWTEYFWHFDRFLRGGQNFELGLLSVLACFCLVLVLLQHGRCGINALLSLRRRLAFVFRHTDPASPGSHLGLITSLHAVPLPSAILGMSNLPLRN
jgi:hypothetical protein